MPLVFHLILPYNEEGFIIKKYALKTFFVISGTLSMLLGITGIFLPVLPTTPFFLLAAFCYMRSSKRLHDWLIHHRIFGEYIYSYLEHRAIRKKAKISALIFLWATMLISIFILSNIYLQFMLVIIGAGASIYILSLRTLTDDMAAKLAKQQKGV